MMIQREIHGRRLRLAVVHHLTGVGVERAGGSTRDDPRRDAGMPDMHQRTRECPRQWTEERSARVGILDGPARRQLHRLPQEDLALLLQVLAANALVGGVRDGLRRVGNHAVGDHRARRLLLVRQVNHLARLLLLQLLACVRPRQRRLPDLLLQQLLLVRLPFGLGILVVRLADVDGGAGEHRVAQRKRRRLRPPQRSMPGLLQPRLRRLRVGNLLIVSGGD